jgi:hypothetical protein
VLTDVPIGAWTTALVFDIAEPWARNPAGQRDPARRCIAVGLVGASASAITGIADRQYTHDNARRFGLAHATLNVAATSLTPAPGWPGDAALRPAAGRSARSDT